VTIEFGFVAIIFFLLLFAMIDLSRAFFTLHDLAAAVREGARFGAVLSDPVADADQIRNVVKQFAISFGGSAVTDDEIDVVYDGDAGRLTVRINDYPFEFIVLPFGTINLTREAVFRYERAEIATG
jgi:Flp pilus assembly protein TadG